MKLNDQAVRDGGLIIRIARKEYRCAGSGSAIENHAPGCRGIIEVGERHLECMWSAPGFHSGSRHTEPCALDFFADWVVA